VKPRDKLAAAADQAGFTNYKKLDSLEEAAVEARREAKAGEVVLLSPACASWDMFQDYEARGKLFKKLVKDPTGTVSGKGGNS